MLGSKGRWLQSTFDKTGVLILSSKWDLNLSSEVIFHCVWSLKEVVTNSCCKGYWAPGQFPTWAAREWALDVESVPEPGDLESWSKPLNNTSDDRRWFHRCYSTMSPRFSVLWHDSSAPPAVQSSRDPCVLPACFPSPVLLPPINPGRLCILPINP